MGEYVYNNKFGGNVLIVVRTGCGKMFFGQKLSINNFFRKIKKVECVFCINLYKNREAEIQSCFCWDVEFDYPKTTISFDNMLEQFKLRSQTAEKIWWKLNQLLKIPVV